MNVIDLRSDTVTLPTDEMLEAIRNAKLGDDVSREDPTVNKLEEISAARFGKEAALLVPSGTAGNLVSVMSHCVRGDEIYCEAEAHVYYYELGGMSAIAGVIPRLIKGRMGVYSAKDLEESFRGREFHFPNPALVAIENTHNRAGGTCWTPKEVESVARKAHELGMKVHIDGARIFNACVALSVDPKAYAKSVDSVTFCLSKGLSCPAGSLIVGDEEFIKKARRNRKILGGGMRQAGIIAAPGIVALDKMIGRLKEDHDNAKVLAKGLVSRCRVKIDMATVQTNIVVADVAPTLAETYIERAKKKGVLLSDFGKYSVRFVTHRGIVEDDIEEVLRRLSVAK